MFKAIWRTILSLFVCSKEERWVRLDRLAETNQEKYRRELAKLSQRELNEYVDSVSDDAEDRINYGWPDRKPTEVIQSTPSNGPAWVGIDRGFKDGSVAAVVEDVAGKLNVRIIPVDEVMSDPREMRLEPEYSAEQLEAVKAAIQAGYSWKPGQEHNDPVKSASRRKRPGVFERAPMNRSQRRKADAVARRGKPSQKASKDAV